MEDVIIIVQNKEKTKDVTFNLVFEDGFMDINIKFNPEVNKKSNEDYLNVAFGILDYLKDEN
jgi:hypothetical protein